MPSNLHFFVIHATNNYFIAIFRIFVLNNRRVIQGNCNYDFKTRGRILGYPDKSLKNFPPSYSQSPLQLCLRFLFLQPHATSYSFCKGERRTPHRKPNPLSYGLLNPYRNLKSENSQDYAQKPQSDCMFMNWASGNKFSTVVTELTPAF